MKKYIFLFVAFFATMNIYAQSSMTDEQVMQQIIKEHERGSSQQQIVTKLMQNGVDINQIRRVRAKYERMQKNEGLGAVRDKSQTKTDDRTRTYNAKERRDMEKYKDENKFSDFRREDGTRVVTRHTYDEDDEEYLDMEDEMNDWMPIDTIAMYEKLVREMERESKKRKVYGRDIFNNKELTFEPNMNIATPADYRLGPGDAVFIEIYGASQKTIESTVSPDGTVTIEGFGPVSVSGLTVSQANAQLRQKLGARYSSSKVRLTVGQTRTIIVNVAGEVKFPGTYTLSAFSTVFNALYMAGGITDIGTLRNIKVYRGGKLISVVDIYDFIQNGKLAGNVRLTDNDMIVVDAYDCLVNITGKVKRPMYYEMKKNESVASLLKYAGGFTGDAYKNSVRLIRKNGKEYSVFNIGEFDMASFHVTDEDSVYVDSIIPRYDNMVELKGAVYRPGMYQVGGDVTSVRTLLEMADGIKEEAFTAHAVMHRMREDRTLEVISVDIDGILNGRVADIPLKANDVLFIPTKQNMMEEQTVTIHGEVYFPGKYKYAANQSIESFILQAGGIKETASTMKVDVSRRVNNPNATATDSIIAHNYTFTLKEGFIIDGEPSFTLQPFDQVYVRKSPGSYEQQNVEVEGEVLFEGSYALSTRTPRLSDLIRACGGVTDRAYIKGAKIMRKYNDAEIERLKEIQDKAREQAELNLQELVAKSGNANMANIKSSNQLEKYKISNSYAVGIELEKALAKPGSDFDIVLREGDKLIVPEYNGTVKINGEVMNANTVAYREGKSVSYYIDQAGGFSSNAKKSQTYIIYMNGNMAKVGHNAKVMPGCEIVVPAKSASRRTMAETMSIATSAGSLAAAIATIANLLK